MGAVVTVLDLGINGIYQIATDRSASKLSKIVVRHYLDDGWSNWTELITNTDLSTYYSMDNAIEIPKNADLNNYPQFGNYISTAASTTDTLKNCPLTGSGFTMHVERITGSRPDYCKQRIIANNSNAREYWRTKIEGVWQKWYMVVGEQVN